MSAFWFYPTLTASGPKNMAWDSAMLSLSARDGSMRLRFYQWDFPTLSFGRNQIPRETSIPWVKRPTGGRAVLHDRELTFAVSLNLKTRDTVTPLGTLYRQLLTPIKETLEQSLATPLEFHPFEQKIHPREEIPCFKIASHNEILWRGRKFVGAAMRSQANGLLIHGSILLDIPNYPLAREFFENAVGAMEINPQFKSLPFIENCRRGFTKIFGSDPLPAKIEELVITDSQNL